MFQFSSQCEEPLLRCHQFENQTLLDQRFLSQLIILLLIAQTFDRQHELDKRRYLTMKASIV